MENELDYSRLGTVIRSLSINLDKLENALSDCCSIKVNQAFALLEVGRSENISLNDLAKMTNLEISTASRLIDGLVSAKLVTRELNPNDRRSVVIRLSPDGFLLFRTLEETVKAYYKQLYQAIPIEKRECVIDGLATVSELIKSLAGECCRGGGKS